MRRRARSPGNRACPRRRRSSRWRRCRRRLRGPLAGLRGRRRRRRLRGRREGEAFGLAIRVRSPPLRVVVRKPARAPAHPVCAAREPAAVDLGRALPTGCPGAPAGLGRALPTGFPGAPAGLGKALPTGCAGALAGLGRALPTGCAGALAGFREKLRREAATLLPNQASPSAHSLNCSSVVVAPPQTTTRTDSKSSNSEAPSYTTASDAPQAGSTTTR